VSAYCLPEQSPLFKQRNQAGGVLSDIIQTVSALVELAIALWYFYILPRIKM
jgi:hypothetical protein